MSKLKSDKGGYEAWKINLMLSKQELVKYIYKFMSGSITNKKVIEASESWNTWTSKELEKR